MSSSRRGKALRVHFNLACGSESRFIPKSYRFRGRHWQCQKQQSQIAIMQYGGGGGDVDRALSSIRARADHLRHTIARLEHNLAWQPASTWPELLSQFMVISKQMENMNEEIPDMIQHFACVPRMATPNPADIPLLLSTREDTEMENADRELMADKPREKSVEALMQVRNAHNEAVESLEETFREMSDGLLKSIRVNKYVTKTKPQSTQSHQFKFIESGSYE